MATWAVLSVTEVADPTNWQWSVRLSIPNAGGIDKELFVVSVETGEYSSVALARDLEVYPTSREEAIEKNLSFYRVSETQKVWDRQSKAAEFALFVRARVNLVVADWAYEEKVAFGGEHTYVYTSSP